MNFITLNFESLFQNNENSMQISSALKIKKKKCGMISFNFPNICGN